MTTTSAIGNTRDTVELFREIFGTVLNKRDADALLPYWDENIVEYFPTGTCRGRDEVHDYFASTFAAIPDFHIEARTIVAEGNTVFVRWHMIGTFSGAAWMGIEPNGARVELDGIDCFTLRDGLVVENFVVYDQISFARQIGLMPAEGSVMDRALLGAFNAKTRLFGRKRA